MTDAGERIPVEVALARPGRQFLVALTVRAGSTVAEVLAQVAPALGADAPDGARAVGIFGEIVPRERIVQPGDRVEIYRPLPADPKDTRRRLAAEGRTMGRAGRRPANPRERGDRLG